MQLEFLPDPGYSMLTRNLHKIKNHGIIRAALYVSRISGEGEFETTPEDAMRKASEWATMTATWFVVLFLLVLPRTIPAPQPAPKATALVELGAPTADTHLSAEAELYVQPQLAPTAQPPVVPILETADNLTAAPILVPGIPPTRTPTPPATRVRQAAPTAAPTNSLLGEYRPPSTQPPATMTPAPTEPPVVPTAASAEKPSAPPPPPPPQEPPASSPGWLSYLNQYRAMAGLPGLTEDSDWSYGAWLHARYIVKNDIIEHDEKPGMPWYTAEGRTAAQSSDLVAYDDPNASDQFVFDTWMQAPFHAIVILDPALHRTGYGVYREADGGLQIGAALDVIRGLGRVASSAHFPIMWPGDGTTVWLRQHYTEWPSPLTSCPGYGAPSGLGIILQIGSGNQTPQVTGHSFSRDGIELEHCIFDETNYYNPDASQQNLGRIIMDQRDAIVLIPRAPLDAGATYVVSITVNGQTYTWSFHVGG